MELILVFKSKNQRTFTFEFICAGLSPESQRQQPG
jgi:hypothetical protein